MFFLVSPWAFGPRKSSEYPWGIEFPLFKLGYLPPVFCWVVFEKIQAVVFFLTPCWTDAVSFISVFIIFEPLLLPVFFDTGNGTIYESILNKVMRKRKPKGTDGIWTYDLLFTRQAPSPLELRRLPWRWWYWCCRGVNFWHGAGQTVKKFFVRLTKNRGMRGWYSKAMI